jgi:hypothetical protein
MNEVMNYKLLLGTELDGFMRKLLPVLVPDDLPQGSIRLLVTQLTASYALFSQGFQHNAKDPFASLVEEKDLARDKRLSSFKNYIKSYITSDVDAEVAAAERVLAVIRRYGWQAESFNYTQESTAIVGLLDELGSKFQPEITLLKASGHSSKLDLAQKAFEEAQNQQVVGNAVVTPTLTAYRKPMVGLLKMLFQAIDTELRMAPTDALKAMSDKIDVLMANAMAIAKARGTRRENQTEEEEKTAQVPVN